MVIDADKGRSDGSAGQFLRAANLPYPVLLISRSETLDFNEQVLSLAGKPFLVFDFVENGWNDQSAETLVVGQNTAQFGHICQNKWERLDEFLAQNKPILYFKRELLKKDKTEWLLPVEYPNLQNPYPVQTKAEFDARPISVFNYWGRSHEARVQLHGEIWKNASKGGYSVCDNLYYLSEFMKHESGKKWVSLWIPHYARIDISILLAINGQSKMCLSLPGAGIKCFRSTGEAPCNSVMVCKEDGLAWSYEWVHRENCIKFHEFGGELEVIENALKRESLYEVYLNGVATAEKYQTNNYIGNYLLPLINKT